MTALEWLDTVRADLDEATPWPWVVESGTHALYIESPIDDETCTPVGEVYGGSPVSETDACLIASAPDRLDQMERALRAVLEMHRPRPNTVSALFPHPLCECGLEWGDDGCPTVTTIQEALG